MMRLNGVIGDIFQNRHFISLTTVGPADVCQFYKGRGTVPMNFLVILLDIHVFSKGKGK